MKYEERTSNSYDWEAYAIKHLRNANEYRMDIYKYNENLARAKSCCIHAEISFEDLCTKLNFKEENKGD